jgi:Fe-S oxidoreductase
VGIAPQRRLPAFARRSFRAGFEWRRDDGPGARGEVLLWPDTFNDHFHPQVAHAAVRVLRHAGFAVRLPRRRLCCGRPLYEFGYLDAARAYLRRVLEALDDELRAGTPIVVLEPACLSVFKEELPMMLPHDEQARRLRQQSFLLSDFLQQRAPDLVLAPLHYAALVHLHCHHKSVLGTEAELALLEKTGLDLRQPDSGCCGMAGSFGFEARKYEVSMRCAERVLLPAVREMAPQALLIADGYSCREQIVQATGRAVHHLAEVLCMALPGGGQAAA